MAMEHYLAGSSIRTSPTVAYASDFNAMLDLSFANAPNLFTDVYKETSYGSATYEAISQVRVSAVFDPSTGQNLGDDFKKFMFDGTFTSPSVGQLFSWKNSYWIAVNSDNYQSLSQSLVVRRCNNVLKWKDEYNNTVEEPCVLSYVLKESGDYTTSQMMISSGFITVFCQRNARTITVKENDRFLFGVPNHRKAYRVYGNGVKLYLNSETTNETSPSVAEFYMGASPINDETDDIVNGIANVYNNDYSVTILDGDIIQVIDFSKTLSAEVKHESVIVSEDVVWTTGDETIVSITTGGVITCESVGSTIIRCALASNTAVYDEITVYVQSALADNYNVEINPETTVVYEGETETYNCVLTNNGVATADTFSFIGSGVPVDNYRLYVTDGNNFRVENIEKYLVTPLTVTCTSGVHVKTINITLRGDW